jgi:hypothetical protein
MEVATAPNYIERTTGAEFRQSVQSQSVGTFGALAAGGSHCEDVKIGKMENKFWHLAIRLAGIFFQIQFPKNNSPKRWYNWVEISRSGENNK